MNNSEEGFEQNNVFGINGNHTLNTSNTSAVGRKIICTYYFNEKKGLEEPVKN